ncbi:MAG TPA: universal stress protein [Thermoflexales bacterium]|nr:universal stress protein [Thermoflexales bacterium]HQX09979.1 universal stress protein [Thermoflexales bacterium]HQY23713.1 universal stress protein [Thermoflexales bacterium]HQZ52610.1 universal stress protein [Thermoflexales bacterium]HRA53345.1 universal stress protein [Thermoflexales bacterium]
MFKKIFVPLDGSAFAETALRHAETLARCFGAELILAQVVSGVEQTMFVSPPVEYEGGHYDPVWSARQLTAHVPNPLVGPAEEYLRATARTLLAGGIRAQTEVLEGNVAHALLTRIESIGADAVVMCTHGRGGLSRALLGSVADRISHHTSVPVLLVRPGDSRSS